MRVAVLGMGAIGHLIARALEGQADLVRVDRTRAPLRDGEPAVDAAVVCVKAQGTPWAAEIAQRILAPGGVVATVQNGLGNFETLAAAVGPGRVSVGVIYVGAELRDGALEATGAGRVELGRPAGAAPKVAPAHKLEDLAAALARGGMDVKVVDDPWPSVWRKLVVNASMNPTTALFRLRNPELLEHPVARTLADELARETARVATAAGVPIASEAAPTMWRATATFVNRSSMFQDVAAGRPTEVDAINGAVAREGARLGVVAPLNEAMTVLIHAVEDAARGTRVSP